MSGRDSSLESEAVTGLIKGIAAWLYNSDIAWVRRLITEHPSIIALLNDPDRLHHIVRKAAHFTEYFVLGLLVIHAVSRTLKNLMGAIMTIAIFWSCVPGIDETIQRFTPGRAGMLRDVLIDMGGFGTALAIALPVLAFGSVLGRGGRHLA